MSEKVKFEDEEIEVDFSLGFKKIPEPAPFPQCCGYPYDNPEDLKAHQESPEHKKMSAAIDKQKRRAEFLQIWGKQNDPQQVLRRKIEAGLDVDTNGDSGLMRQVCPRCGGSGEIGGKG